MKLSNTAKVEKGYIEKDLTIEKDKNGDFKLIATAKPTGNKPVQQIEMTFTENGLTALLGAWGIMLPENRR